MENTKAVILGELLDDIDSKAFELEAWKKKATLVLKKIFGDNDEKLSMIEKLHYEFSSWSLRDSSGGTSYDKVKENARKIIEAAIAELQLTTDNNLVIETLKDELSGKEFAALQSITENQENISQSLNVFFCAMSPERKNELLMALVIRSMER
jgi:hypothetical protein